MRCGRRAWAMRSTAAVAWLCTAALLRAQDAVTVCSEPDAPASEVRRRPGVDSDSAQAVPCDATRMPPPKDGAWPAPTAVIDRWRLVEKLGRPVNLLDPYDASNPIKGDRPLFGTDVFLNLSATSNTLLEPRRIPGSEPLPGTSGEIRTLPADQFFLSQTATFDAVLYKGDTVFRPPDWAWRFTPAINYSATRSDSGTASGGVAAVQALYYERHLRDLDAQYDFDSARVGIQPLISDFRGFLLSDQPLGARLFGTRSNNVFQYNLALFTRLPKDRVRLNDVAQKIPNDQVLLANLYWQDLFKAGTTSEFVFAFNRDRAASVPELQLQNGVASGSTLDARRAYDVAYLGYGMDGHFGRVNSTGMVYGLVGRESRGLLESQATQVRALFAADELSMDFDWRRVRLSMLHSSGDGDPHDRVAQGFDTLSSGALFAGSDSSFFFHQRLATGRRRLRLEIPRRAAALAAPRQQLDRGELQQSGIEPVGAGPRSESLAALDLELGRQPAVVRQDGAARCAAQSIQYSASPGRGVRRERHLASVRDAERDPAPVGRATGERSRVSRALWRRQSLLGLRPVDFQFLRRLMHTPSHWLLLVTAGPRRGGRPRTRRRPRLRPPPKPPRTAPGA